ncbi:MAG: ADP-glyceromanno-heptose 6-epimerase [Kiritimatiellae bacterium]|nr:ADP-glyceromanno-heptose 6-epimerase [Kiritimatiellia bacterium]
MSIQYIVTGGAGFIGSNVVKALNERGEQDILIVDHLRNGEKWKNLTGIRFEDYMDKEAFLTVCEAGAFPDVRAVIHLGACSSTTETDADYLMENNYRYTRRLCEWCLERNIRFVYASSAATYGNGALGYSDDDAVTPNLRPLNMYGYSKHLFDLWAMKNKLFDRIAGLKYFNVYGPGEAHKNDMRSVVHKAFNQIRETGQVCLFKSYRPEYGDGQQVRDFIYVRDAVAVSLFFADHPETSGLFNCGTGTARSWNDLALAVFAAMDLPPRIEYIDMPETLRAKYQYHTQSDVRKLRGTGYTAPFQSLEEGIEDYVKNHLMSE